MTCPQTHHHIHPSHPHLHPFSSITASPAASGAGGDGGTGEGEGEKEEEEEEEEGEEEVDFGYWEKADLPAADSPPPKKTDGHPTTASSGTVEMDLSLL